MSIVINYFVINSFVNRNIDTVNFSLYNYFKVLWKERILINKNYLLSGFTEFLILSLLYNQDSYVYEIVKKITEFSDNFLSISQNTIYTATYKLVSDGKISEYSKLVGKKRTRIYYHLEPSGKKYLDELTENYNNVTNGINNIVLRIHDKRSWWQWTKYVKHTYRKLKHFFHF